MTNDALIILLALSGSFCFGLTAVILKLGVENQNVFSGLIIRVLGSAPVLIALNILLFGPTFFVVFLQIEIISMVLFASSLMVITDLLLMYTLKSKAVGAVIPVVAINPLFTAIFLVVAGEEEVSLDIFILTFFIIIGIILVTFERNGKNGNPSGNTSFRDIVDLNAMAAGLTIALFLGLMTFVEITILKRDDINGFSYSAAKIFCLGLISILALFFAGNKIADLKSSFSKKSSVKYLILAGFVGWTLGAVLVYTSFDLGSAVTVNLIVGISPVFAVIVSLAIKMEKFSALKFIGILLCVLSSIFLII